MFHRGVSSGLARDLEGHKGFHGDVGFTGAAKVLRRVLQGFRIVGFGFWCLATGCRVVGPRVEDERLGLGLGRI